MKYFFPALMGLLILAGIVLTVTPFVAEQFFPTQETSFRKANPDDVKQALRDWFRQPQADFRDARAIRQVSAKGTMAWFRFEVERQAVERFIVANRMKQEELTDDVMQGVFMRHVPPVDWWQPASLQRETYFQSGNKDQALNLIYDAESETGYFLVVTLKP